MVNVDESADTAGQRADNPNVRVIGRAVEILRVLHASQDTGMSLAQIARRVGLARSTVHRIITALEAERFVSSPRPDGYQLGTGLLELARYSANDRVANAVQPFLAGFGRELGETVGLAVLEGGYTEFTQQVPGVQPLRAEFVIGATMPVHCTASGKALLSELSPGASSAVLSEHLERHTASTVTDQDALAGELEQIRSEGVAYERDEYIDGVSGLAAVIHDPLGRRVALVVSLPSARFRGHEERISGLLLRTRERIEKALTAAFPDTTGNPSPVG